MGDWPWMVKAGCLGRSFHNAAKRQSSRAAPKGICHNCCADMEGYPWEDWCSETPKWIESINTSSPFLRRPALLETLPCDPSDEPGYFSHDLFHAWHIGAGKSFLSSAVVALASSDLYDGSQQARIERVSEAYSTWCKNNHESPTLKKFTLANVGWTGNTYPSGTWSKGATTTCIMKWFLAECEANMDAVRRNHILFSAYKAAWFMNSFLKGVYSFEVWIPSSEALILATHGMNFLKQFGYTVRLCSESSKLLFIQMPNFHRLHHLFYSMKVQAGRGRYALNCLALATQCDEDFIGRPSRVSRRVNQRTIIKRTLQRSLIAAYAKYVETRRIVPGCWKIIHRVHTFYFFNSFFSKTILFWDFWTMLFGLGVPASVEQRCDPTSWTKKALGGEVVLKYGIWMVVKILEFRFPGFGLRMQVFQHVLQISRSRLA